MSQPRINFVGNMYTTQYPSPCLSGPHKQDGTTKRQLLVELRRRTVHIAHTYLCAVRFTTLFDTAIPIAALRRRICCTVHASITRSPMAACMVKPYVALYSVTASIAATLALLSSGVYCLWLHDAAARP